MSADLLTKLIEAGTPAALVAEVALAIAKGQAANDVLEQRRAKDRARKVPRISTETEESAEIQKGPLSLSPDENNSNPHTHTPEHKPRARKGHRLPVEWTPQPIAGELCEALSQWPPGAADRELERFRDWAASATGQTALKNDWQAAWRNWLRRAEDEGRYRNGRLPQRADSMGRPGADASGASLFADLQARRAARTI